MTVPLDAMLLAGVVPNRHTFNAMLEAHAAAGDATSAKDVYDTMKDHRIKADHCTFIALFKVSINKCSVVPVLDLHSSMLQGLFLQLN